jgi:hypothetical protein
VRYKRYKRYKSPSHVRACRSFADRGRLAKNFDGWISTGRTLPYETRSSERVAVSVFHLVSLSKNIPTRGPLNCRSLHCAPPDFLSRLVALANFMRLSLRRAAYVVAGESRGAGNPGTLCRKICARIAVLPTQANRRLEWATHQLFIRLGGPRAHLVSPVTNRTAPLPTRYGLANAPSVIQRPRHLA